MINDGIFIYPYYICNDTSKGACTKENHGKTKCWQKVLAKCCQCVPPANVSGYKIHSIIKARYTYTFCLLTIVYNVSTRSRKRLGLGTLSGLRTLFLVTLLALLAVLPW